MASATGAIQNLTRKAQRTMSRICWGFPETPAFIYEFTQYVKNRAESDPDAEQNEYRRVEIAILKAFRDDREILMDGNEDIFFPAFLAICVEYRLFLMSFGEKGVPDYLQEGRWKFVDRFAKDACALHRFIHKHDVPYANSFELFVDTAPDGFLSKGYGLPSLARKIRKELLQILTRCERPLSLTAQTMADYYRAILARIPGQPEHLEVKEAKRGRCCDFCGQREADLESGEALQRVATVSRPGSNAGEMLLCPWCRKEAKNRRDLVSGSDSSSGEKKKAQQSVHKETSKIGHA